MSTTNERCTKCHGDHETGSIYCPKFNEKKITDSTKVSSSAKSTDSSYIVQIVSIGIRPDNFYEAKMLLAPEIDMSSTKITVKGNNLRISVQRHINKELTETIEKLPFNDLTKRFLKHRENLLIPESIDGDEHCLDNAIVLRRYDHIDLKMISSGFKTRLKLSQIPNFYTINNEEYFAAEIKIEGFKVSTAALATENVLNIKLQELGGRRHVRNINFFIPTEANAKVASIEVFDDNTIFMRVPLVGNF